MTVFQSLSRHWPVQIDLFATSANHCCLNYFSPYQDPQSVGTDLLLLPRPRLRYPDLHRLRFHAWRLSGASPERRVSRRR